MQTALKAHSSTLLIVGVVAALLVAESNCFSPQHSFQQIIDKDLGASEVIFSMIINQVAVLKLLNESSTICSLHERELQERLNRSIDLDVKTEEVKSELQKFKEATLLEMKNETQEAKVATLMEIENETQEAKKAALLEIQHEMQDAKEAALLAIQNELLEMKNETQKAKETALLEIQNETQEAKGATLLAIQNELQETREATLLEMKNETQETKEAALLEIQNELQQTKEVGQEEMQNELQKSKEAALLEMKNELQEAKEAALFELKSLAMATIKEIKNTSEETISMLNEGKEIRVAAIVSSQATTTSHECESGWSEYHWSCYKVFKTRVTNSVATERCRALGAHLATISTVGENSFVTGLVSAGTYIGMDDDEEEGVWTWRDGTPFSYSNWRSDQPNGGTSENCGEIDQQSVWWDRECAATRHYICEKRLP